MSEHSRRYAPTQPGGQQSQPHMNDPRPEVLALAKDRADHHQGKRVKRRNQHKVYEAVSPGTGY